MPRGIYDRSGTTKNEAKPRASKKVQAKPGRKPKTELRRASKSTGLWIANQFTTLRENIELLAGVRGTVSDGPAVTAVLQKTDKELVAHLEIFTQLRIMAFGKTDAEEHEIQAVENPSPSAKGNHRVTPLASAAPANSSSLPTA